MRKGEVVALGEGRASISKCGEWIELPPEVTKTNKGRNVPIVNADANAAAHRIASDLMNHYTKKKFEHRWSLVKREYARNDSSFVYHVTRHNCASKMANELEQLTVIVAEMLGHNSRPPRNGMLNQYLAYVSNKCDVTIYHLSRRPRRPFC